MKKVRRFSIKFSDCYQDQQLKARGFHLKFIECYLNQYMLEKGQKTQWLKGSDDNNNDEDITVNK